MSGQFVLVQGDNERRFPTQKAARDVARVEGGKLYREWDGKRLFVMALAARPELVKRSDRENVAADREYFDNYPSQRAPGC